MSSSVSPTNVRFDEDTLWVDLSDGRTLGVPLAWFPRLLQSTPEQRAQVRLSSRGLHWDALDEDNFLPVWETRVPVGPSPPEPRAGNCDGAMFSHWPAAPSAVE